MRIERLVIKDFNTIGEAAIDLGALPSVVMIAGRLKDAGASSNGAGKSTILDAMTWCLFGKELRDRASGSMVRDGAPSCHVEVTFRREDDTLVKISRHRKKSGGVEVEIDGKRSSTASGGQEKIEQLIGFTFDLFTKTVVFGGDFNSFCRMTAAARTELLEEMLGVRHYLHAADTARESAKVLDEKVEAIAEAKRRAAEAIESARREFLEAAGAAGRIDDQRERERAELVRSIASLNMRIDREVERLNAARDAAASVERAHAKAVEDWAAQGDGWRSAVAEAEKAQTKAEKEAAAVQGELRTAERELRDAEDQDKSRVCRACGRPIDAHAKPVNLKPYRERIEELRGIYAKRQEHADKQARSLAKARAQADEHAASRPAPPDTVRTADDLRVKIARMDGELDALYRRVRDLDRDGDDSAERAMEQRWQEFLTAREEHRSAKDRRAKFERELAIAKYWAHGFGRDGIPSVLLEATAPALNAIAKPIADILTDGAYSIKFETVVKGSRSDFRVNVSNVQGGRSYDDLSKGERVRADLCVLFAIRQLMLDSASLKCDQLFLDELLDGLDEQGVEYAARLIRSRHVAKQTVFISHADGLKEAADAVVLVTKRGGVSTVKVVNP